MPVTGGSAGLRHGLGKEGVARQAAQRQPHQLLQGVLARRVDQVDQARREGLAALACR
jgi:hypothetical protein